MSNSGEVYFCLHLHGNFWYAEYQPDQAIRQFVKLYEAILDVFEKHNGAAACWDFETQLTLDILKEASPSFINRLNKLITDQHHDVIPCTWATAIATHLTREEFDLNFNETNKAIKKVFPNIPPTWMSQDGGFAPAFVPILKEKGIKYLLLDQRNFNRYYRHQLTPLHKFRAITVSGQGATLPCVMFGLDGLNSYGNFANAVKKKMEDLKPIRKQYPTKDFLIYPFIDAERFNPKWFDDWLTQIEKMGLKYCTPSQFLEKNPVSEGTFELDVEDWHDWSFHNDILIDHQLWTYIERAREKIQEAEWWMQFAKTQSLQILGKNLSKYYQMLDDALKDVQIAQGSDKSHWYASQHKVDVGLRYATGAFEKASYVCGILSRITAYQGKGMPDRSQSMKEAKINLSLLNPFPDIAQYPKDLPIGLEFPYITTVNMNTKPCYEIQDYPPQNLKLLTPTIFNIVPGLNVHNLRTEIFYQLHKPLNYGESLALTLSPQEEELEYKKSAQGVLENDLIKVSFSSTGNIVQITEKTQNLVFSAKQNKDEALLFPKFEVHLQESELVSKDLELVTIDNDIPFSLDFERQSAEKDNQHRLHLTTKYRIFPNFAGLLIDSFAAIAGPIPGDFCPFEMDLGSIQSFTREVLDQPLTSKPSTSTNQQIFLNDWCLFSSEQGSLGVAFEKRIRSCKQLLYTKINESVTPIISLGFVRNFPEWVALNLLQGVIHQRLWVVPFSDKCNMPEKIKFLKQLTKPPILDWYL